jgi:hypothetical protein
MASIIQTKDINLKTDSLDNEIGWGGQAVCYSRYPENHPEDRSE